MPWIPMKWEPVPRRATGAVVPWKPKSAARGCVFKRGNTWHYEVYVGSVVVLADNTNSWRRIFDACLRDVAAADRMVRAGHHLRSWKELVDEASRL